jgi:hypothetical protein
MSVCTFRTLSLKIPTSIHISMICHIDPMFRFFTLILAIMFRRISFIVEKLSFQFTLLLVCFWALHAKSIFFFRFFEFGQCWIKIQYLQLPCISAKAILSVYSVLCQFGLLAERWFNAFLHRFPCMPSNP